MKRGIVLCLMSAVLWAMPAVGEEPTRKEEQFLKELVAALSHESDQVRHVAAEALILMGAKAAHHIVCDVRRVKPGTRDEFVRILVAIGTPTLQELATRKALPGGEMGRIFKEVREVLLGKSGEGGFGAGDPAVAAMVEAIMSELPTNQWYSHDPAIDRLAFLGRPAIPKLLTYLDPNDEVRHGSRADWAASALVKILKETDIPRLGALLDDGWHKVAKLFKEMDARRGVPYLVKALERGQLTYEIGCALLHFEDPHCRKAVVAYLDKYGLDFPSGTSDLLDLCVQLRAREALPAVMEIHKAASEPPAFDTSFPPGLDERLRKEIACGRAMAGLGELTGIPLLIEVLDRKGTMCGWLVRRAGETLNRVTGQRFWQHGGDGARARDQYRAWFDQHKARLEWSEAKRQFEVP